MKHIKAILLSLITVVAATNVFAIDPIFTPWNNNLAIRGYDTVAYFTDNQAIKGNRQYSVEWQGATWRFVSNEHKTMFLESPEKYAPQYGGYCAYAVAKNDTASIDPTQFLVRDGKLYLNYDNKVQEKWLANLDEFIEQADKNWPILLNQ